MPLPYWRELTGDGQKAAIADADEYFASLIPPSVFRKQVTAAEYRRVRRLAEIRMRSFDVPAEFSARARKGLFTSLMMMALEEERDPNYDPPGLLGSFQCLLLKPD